MILANEDELAIHTVAAAAYRVLRDLKEKHGRRELNDRLGLVIFAVANDLASVRRAKGGIDTVHPLSGTEIRALPPTTSGEYRISIRVCHRAW